MAVTEGTKMMQVVDAYMALDDANRTALAALFRSDTESDALQKMSLAQKRFRALGPAGKTYVLARINEAENAPESGG